MHLFVKMATGKSFGPQVDGYWTVRQLKEHIQDKEGIPPEYQRMIFAGRELEDDRCLADYSM